MKKISRRAFLKGSALAAGAAALTACGSSDTASSAEEGGVVTLSFFDKNSGSKTFDDPVAQQIMAATGVQLSVENPTGDPDEKLNLMLSGQNYPDIILMGQGDIANRYIEAGALVELDDLLEENCPNLLEMYGDTLEKCRHTDGHIYWVANWYGKDTDPCSSVLMRRDFLAEIVGQERAESTEPFTQSEYHDILRKFKELHPQVGGQDSLPLTVVADSSGSFGALRGMFGQLPYYMPDDKTLQYWTRDPKYMESMLFLNDLYNEGLLDSEWVVNKKEQWQQKMAAGYAFSTFNAYWETDTINTTLAASVGPDAQFYPYKVVADGLTADQTTYNGRSSLGWDAIAITKNCKHVDAALRLYDYLASEEGQYLLLWGIEGKDWNMVDGKYVPDQEVLDGLLHDFDNTSNETGIRKWTWFIKNGNGSDGTPYDLSTKYQLSATGTFANQVFGDSDYYDTIYYNSLEPVGSSVLGLQWQKVTDVMTQNYAKIVNAASHEEAQSIYQDMMQQMEDAGLKDCEESITEQYLQRLELWGEA